MLKGGRHDRSRTGGARFAGGNADAVGLVICKAPGVSTEAFRQEPQEPTEETRKPGRPRKPAPAIDQPAKGEPMEGRSSPLDLPSPQEKPVKRKPRKPRGGEQVRYSAWGVDGAADTFIAGDQLPEWLRRMDPELQILKVFEASSWNEAMRQYHEWQGWEPYKPMLNADGREYPEDSTAVPPAQGEPSGGDETGT